MKVSKEEIGENKVVLNVEVEVDEVNNALNQAYQKIVKNVEIDGFRKGKVPRSVLEARYGEEVLHKDALDILIPNKYQEAIVEAEIEPIAQPEIDDIFIEKDKVATFTAEVEVKPEVKLGAYTGLDIEKEEVEIEEEQISAKLEEKRNEFSALKVSEREKVEEGDFVIIDFEGYHNGETFEGGAGEDYTLEIGSGTFIPGFEEGLIGAEIGEEVEVDVTFPEEYQAENLAGEGVLFKVKVKDIKEKELPELNDEFAQEVGDFESLDELKADITNKLKEESQAKSQQQYENELIEAIAAETEINIPEAMVDSQIDEMIMGIKQRLQQQGASWEQYLDRMQTSEAEFRAQYRDEAEQRVRINLSLEAIAEAEEIEATEEEIEARIEQIAEQQNQDPEMIKSLLQMQGQYQSIVDGVKIENTVKFLTENN